MLPASDTSAATSNEIDVMLDSFRRLSAGTVYGGSFSVLLPSSVEEAPGLGFALDDHGEEQLDHIFGIPCLFNLEANTQSSEGENCEN